MKHQAIVDHLVSWLKDYHQNTSTKGYVVGISGGIDSALTSTLCALTGAPTLVVSMPIHQEASQVNRAQEQGQWLCDKFSNVSFTTCDLSRSFEAFKLDLPEQVQDDLTLANLRARLRMSCLYGFAGNSGRLVAGTGNKVEDFGIGFFTKYGDGGVDLSPIADLNKTEVYALAKHLAVPQSIQQAAPTDGLWGDDRNDEDQIGASYPELEWAMEFTGDESALSPRQKEVLNIYRTRHKANKHKMVPIPVCLIPEGLK